MQISCEIRHWEKRLLLVGLPLGSERMQVLGSGRMEVLGSGRMQVLSFLGQQAGPCLLIPSHLPASWDFWISLLCPFIDPVVLPWVLYFFPIRQSNITCSHHASLLSAW